MVNIHGLTPSGSSVTLGIIKIAYRPSEVMPCSVFESAGTDKGKARVYIDTSGQILLETSSALQYGVYYNICYMV